MKELVLANPGWTFAIVAILGAVLHWAKKAYRGDVSWDFLAYWLGDNPGNSGFTAGALATAIWAVVFSDSLAGMQWHMILSGGFTLGWMLDSGINKASKPMTSAPKQAGFARVGFLMALAFVVVSGCALVKTSTEPLHSKPSTEAPAVKAVRVSVDETNAMLVALNNVIGNNVATGVWTPDQAQAYLSETREAGRKVDAVREMLRTGAIVGADAQAQAEAISKLVLRLHQRIAAEARKEN